MFVKRRGTSSELEGATSPFLNPPLDPLLMSPQIDTGPMSQYQLRGSAPSERESAPRHLFMDDMDIVGGELGPYSYEERTRVRTVEIGRLPSAFGIDELDKLVKQTDVMMSDATGTLVPKWREFVGAWANARTRLATSRNKFAMVRELASWTAVFKLWQARIKSAGGDTIGQDDTRESSERERRADDLLRSLRYFVMRLLYGDGTREPGRDPSWIPTHEAGAAGPAKGGGSGGRGFVRVTPYAPPTGAARPGKGGGTTRPALPATTAPSGTATPSATPASSPTYTPDMVFTPDLSGRYPGEPGYVDPSVPLRMPDMTFAPDAMGRFPGEPGYVDPSSSTAPTTVPSKRVATAFGFPFPTAIAGANIADFWRDVFRGKDPVKEDRKRRAAATRAARTAKRRTVRAKRRAQPRPPMRPPVRPMPIYDAPPPEPADEAFDDAEESEEFE